MPMEANPHLVISTRAIGPMIERACGRRVVSMTTPRIPDDEYPVVIWDLGYLAPRGVVDLVVEWQGRRPDTQFVYVGSGHLPEQEFRLLGQLQCVAPGTVISGAEVTNPATWDGIASGGPPVWHDLLLRLTSAARYPITEVRAVGELLKHAPDIRSMASGADPAYRRVYRTLKQGGQRPPKELVRGFRLSWAVALRERGFSHARIASTLRFSGLAEYRTQLGASFNLTKRDIDRLVLDRVMQVYALALVRTTDGSNLFPTTLQSLPEIGTLLLHGP